MASLQEIRSKYPDYQDLSDQQFADAIHKKFYSDLTKEDFYSRVGYEPPGMFERINQRVNEIGTGVVKGAADVLGLPGDIRQNDPNSLFMLGSVAPFLLPALAAGPTGEEVRESAFNAIPDSAPSWLQLPQAEPQDTAGRYLQEAGRGAGSMLAIPGPTGPLMRAGVAGGVGGEGAVDLSGTRGTGGEIWARLVGNILGAGTGALAEGAIKPTNPSILADATQGMTQAQFREAQSRMDAARRMGAPLTGAESIAQTTGSNQYLTAAQRVAEQSRGGGRIMADFLATRPEGNASAARQFFDRIAPESAAPERLAEDVAGGADAVVRNELGKISEVVKPSYTAARMAPVVEEQLQPILSKIETEIAAVGPSSEAGKRLIAFRDKIAPGGKIAPNVGALDQLYKETRDLLNLLPTDANAVQSAVKGILGPINREFGDALTRMNDDLAYGRSMFKLLSAENVDPLLKGIVGRLANAKGFEDIQAKLVPVNPKDIGPSSLSAAVKLVRQQAPEALDGFVRRFLDSTYSEASRELIGGPNMFGGAKFRAAIVGNKEQEANLKALIEALPGGNSAWVGFNRFLDVLQAQGRRSAPGSATEFNKQLSQDLGTGTVKFTVKPLGALQEAYERWRYGANTEELARILTDPKSVDLIKSLAFEKPNTARAAAVAASIVTGSTSLRPASR